MYYKLVSGSTLAVLSCDRRVNLFWMLSVVGTGRFEVLSSQLRVVAEQIDL